MTGMQPSDLIGQSRGCGNLRRSSWGSIIISHCSLGSSNMLQSCMETNLYTAWKNSYIYKCMHWEIIRAGCWKINLQSAWHNSHRGHATVGKWIRQNSAVMMLTGLSQCTWRHYQFKSTMGRGWKVAGMANLTLEAEESPTDPSSVGVTNDGLASLSRQGGVKVPPAIPPRPLAIPLTNSVMQCKYIRIHLWPVHLGLSISGFFHFPWSCERTLTNSRLCGRASPGSRFERREKNTSPQHSPFMVARSVVYSSTLFLSK